MSDCELIIDKLWDKSPIDGRYQSKLSYKRTKDGVKIRIDAPFYDDPAPKAPIGRLDRLWQYEVVELFLVGPDGHYIELEFGPHGHWLGFAFSSPRVLSRDDLSIDFRLSERSVDKFGLPRWFAEGWIADGPSKQPIVSANAFAVHGIGEFRTYEVAFALPGHEPNFHQPADFPAAQK